MRTLRRGTAFVYSLNLAARVTIRVKRLRTKAKPVKLVRTSAAGRNRVRFTGRVRGRALRPGAIARASPPRTAPAAAPRPRS